MGLVSHLFRANSWVVETIYEASKLDDERFGKELPDPSSGSTGVQVDSLTKGPDKQCGNPLEVHVPDRAAPRLCSNGLPACSLDDNLCRVWFIKKASGHCIISPRFFEKQDSYCRYEASITGQARWTNGVSVHVLHPAIAVESASHRIVTYQRNPSPPGSEYMSWAFSRLRRVLRNKSVSPPRNGDGECAGIWTPGVNWYGSSSESRMADTRHCVLCHVNQAYDDDSGSQKCTSTSACC